MIRDALRSWRYRRQSRAGEKLTLLLYEKSIVDMRPPTRKSIVLKLPDEVLHRFLAKDIPTEARIALEREQRRREASEGPAGRANRISIAALIVAIAALAMSAIGLTK